MVLMESIFVVGPRLSHVADHQSFSSSRRCLRWSSGLADATVQLFDALAIGSEMWRCGEALVERLWGLLLWLDLGVDHPARVHWG